MEEITYASDLTQRGYPPEEVARLVRSGELIRIRRGAYLTSPDQAPVGARATHLRLVRATVAQCPAEGVVSHMSAAVVHGLPIWSEGSIGSTSPRTGAALRPGHDPERELFNEKRREDRIRDQGLQVVRWVTADIERPADLFARLERAFGRGRCQH